MTIVARAITVCRPVIDRLRSNRTGYWPRYRWCLALTTFAAVADFGSTVHFMTRDGVEHELHPAIRIASMIFGPIAGPLIGKLGQLMAIILVTVCWRVIAGYVYFAAIMMYVWAAWYNVWGRHLYTPVLVEWMPKW